MPRVLAPRDLFGHKIKPIEIPASETRRHISIYNFVRWIAPDITIWHCPNGGKREDAEAAKLKRMGVLAGVLDLQLMIPPSYPIPSRTAFWECKTPKGRLSDEQKDFIKQIERCGHTWAIVRSIEDARAELRKLNVVTREVMMGL
jgi:VRR-NUC domain